MVRRCFVSAVRHRLHEYVDVILVSAVNLCGAHITAASLFADIGPLLLPPVVRIKLKQILMPMPQLNGMAWIKMGGFVDLFRSAFPPGRPLEDDIHVIRAAHLRRSISDGNGDEACDAVSPATLCSKRRRRRRLIYGGATVALEATNASSSPRSDLKGPDLWMVYLGGDVAVYLEEASRFLSGRQAMTRSFFRRFDE
ncbi:hypothetical protein GWI33_022038 [Rhynchophorus ferrugineus]|uniref:Uncharacterized protein n=1 Tax=Rhynchophorus ferrugineus TaxID=354439 RepID=A0A834MMQ8_RHYFE|nr:hypothetical protein GWI33_022038 [Rhynchophorus ferrugineus]